MECWTIWLRMEWSEYQSRSRKQVSCRKSTLILTLTLINKLKESVLRWHRLSTWMIQCSLQRQSSSASFQMCRLRSLSRILKTYHILASCTSALASLKRCELYLTQAVQILGFSQKKVQRPWRQAVRFILSTRRFHQLSRSPRLIKSIGWRSVSEVAKSEATSSLTKSWWDPLTTWAISWSCRTGHLAWSLITVFSTASSMLWSAWHTHNLPNVVLLHSLMGWCSQGSSLRTSSPGTYRIIQMRSQRFCSVGGIRTASVVTSNGILSCISSSGP